MKVIHVSLFLQRKIPAPRGSTRRVPPLVRATCKLFVNLGSFLSNKLSPVCSSSLSIFLPPWLCSQLGTGQCLPRHSVKRLGHLATWDMKPQLWPCHLLFFSPTLKSKNPITTPKPSAKYGSNHRSQGKGPPELSLCIPHPEQAHGSRATWAPPPTPFPVPVAAPAQTWSWRTCLPMYMHFSPSECSSSV